MLYFGADPLIANRDQATVFDVGCQFGCVRACTLLLDSYAHPSSLYHTPTGTAMHTAARFDRPMLIALLFARGCGVNRRDTHGDTPLHLAIRSGAIGACRLLCYVSGEWEAISFG